MNETTIDSRNRQRPCIVPINHNDKIDFNSLGNSTNRQPTNYSNNGNNSIKFNSIDELYFSSIKLLAKV